MPFYDVLCPLVPENEKGSQGVERAERLETARQRDRVTKHYLLCPFMTFYALWYPRMKKGKKESQGAERLETTRPRATIVQHNKKKKR